MIKQFNDRDSIFNIASRLSGRFNKECKNVKLEEKGTQ